MNDRSRKDLAAKAIVITSCDGPEALAITEPPDPVPVTVTTAFGTSAATLADRFTDTG